MCPIGRLHFLSAVVTLCQRSWSWLSSLADPPGMSLELLESSLGGADMQKYFPQICVVWHCRNVMQMPLAAMAAMAAMIDSYRFYRYCSFLQIEMKMFALWVCHFEDSSVQSLLGFVLFVPLAPRISSCRPSCDVAWCSYLSGRCRMCKAPGEVGVLRPS